MRLSKIYSNQYDIFEPVRFVPGLNVVLAEIRLPDNRNKDTHNLGKSTLGRLLDFCFLSNRDPGFFLFKHIDVFVDFVFYLEIELLAGSFVTVRRSVSEPSRIAFQKHSLADQDLTTLDDGEWNHSDIPFDRAKEMLDGYLDWRALKPWSYRKGLGYQLRSQDDYRDVFQLQRYSSGHSEWKPFLAHLLGFDAELIGAHYSKAEEIQDLERTMQTLSSEQGAVIQDASKIEGTILIKSAELDKKQKLLDSFDFRAQDREHNKKLIDDIDERLAVLNNLRYSLGLTKKRVTSSIGDDAILFDPDEARRLFGQIGVLFDGQIKRDFEQLIEFNRAITEERRGYLLEELADIDRQLAEISSELNVLGRKRSETLAYLSSTDSFDKYKVITNELVSLRADVVALERQREVIRRLQEIKNSIRSLKDERGDLQEQIEADIGNQNANPESMFSAIRLFFNAIVESVLARQALITVSQNQIGNLEFRAEILNEVGNASGADVGHTYRKLLCIAFDLAIVRAHIGERFPRFVFHDGVFESLDDRKKENLVAVLRDYANLGIQSIVTLIDSDLPTQLSGSSPLFGPADVVLLLHDENETGRLFKTHAW